MATIRIAIIVTVAIVAAMINCAVLTMRDVQSTSGENETQQSTSGENETQQSTGQQLQLDMGPVEDYTPSQAPHNPSIQESLQQLQQQQQQQQQQPLNLSSAGGQSK